SVLEFMEMGRPLAGNSREVLRRVRDPEQVVGVFREFNLPLLDVHGMHDVPPRDGNWLVKPLHSGGGRGIAIWNDETPVPDEPYYFQQRARGDSYSAVFVAPTDQRDVRFVGITRQIIGDARLGEGPFAWCGSVGPETLSVGTEQLVRRIGNVLSWKLGLAGLFGFDFIVDSDGLPRLTEVNPRYTGSIEVLEHTLGLVLVRDHCAQFGLALPDTVAPSPGVKAMGKFILYSDRDLMAPDPTDWLLPDEWIHAEMWRHVPRLADVPPAGTMLRAGQPICSLFVTGGSSSECLDGLPQRLASVLSRLDLPPR
ncbi:MAG: ATP-grasp domain-containing protein, partial [Planctomycetaceae bacterium]